MEYRENYYDTMANSQRVSSQGEWSPPPPQFEEHDHIYTAQDSSHANSPPSPYSAMPHSPPPPLSPSLHTFQHVAPQEYNQGVSTEKETPYTTHMAVGSPTPDYSAPQVVPSQRAYPFGSQPFSPASHGGSTLGSPQPRPYTFKEHVDTNDQHTSRAGSVPPPVPPKDDRKCGMKKRTFCLLMGCVVFWLIALAVGLGAGLGIGLKKKGGNEVQSDPFCREHPRLCIGGALNAEYISKKGAFNGSGIALAGESWNPNDGTLFTLYFQHHTGDIRSLKYTKGQKWVGGSESTIVASDAKNATPISAVSYVANATQFFHVFYVGKDNTVKQVTQTNASTTALLWTPGTINSQNLKVYDSPSSGLQACWKGNYYGDSDFTNFPTNTGKPNEIPFDNRLGMNLWYALDNSTFQQYAWYAGNDDWQQIKKWQGFNTQAGVGCFSWGAGTTQYAMMVSKDEDVEFYWKDSDTNTSTQVRNDEHPINAWENATAAAIQDVWPSTSLGYTSFFYAQLADRSIRGYDVLFGAENTSYPHRENFTVQTPAAPLYALGGTHFSVTSVSEMNEKGDVLYDSLYVFFQTQGDDITAATRRVHGGEWTIAPLKVPDA
ncbi:uncharacterized protein EKO05_0004610 [Ascochyta rabiei]|uniref:uncharacterized protein n=1 Tax=Didymella rabiei TaxID=5454 RepID=UPI001902AC04|nr:uncharacterized protein EKO05_0004610 [Ascochyta rabiei]UPX14119.1 hypothetical protein EKO05_0004610 [Ascochyta rabiei]